MKKITKLVLALVLCVVGAGVNSVKAEIVTTKTPIILSGGKFAECFVPGTYAIEMQGDQHFIAYEDENGIEFDESSTMVFDLEETVENGNVRVTFYFNDGTNRQEWWCLGIGSSADDTSTPYGHNFDESTYWLKKGLKNVWEEKKSSKITKVRIDNFSSNDQTSIYKIQGGTICGQSMTIKNDNAKTFGAYGGVFKATASQTNIFKMQNFEVGDYQKVVIKFGEKVPAGWAYNYQSNVWPPDIPTDATEIEIPLNGENLPELTIFNWNANPDPIEIDEVYFYKEVNNIEAVELFKAPAGTTDLNGMTGTGTIKWDVTYPQKIGPGIGWLGDIDTDNKSVNILTYDYLHFVVSNVEDGKKLSLRVFVSDEERSDNEKRHCLYPRPITEVADVSDWETAYYISSPGTYVVKISNYPLLRGFKGGNGYWGDESNGTITVSQAYVSSGAPVAYVPTNGYVLAGASTGSASLAAALADASAIYYDATGVIATGVELTPANPNALFTANEGALSNANNVIVNGTCANLVLTDGYPFAVPGNHFTATSASYTTTIDETAKAGTLALPFAAAIPEGVKAYTLFYTGKGEATASEKTSIEPNVPVLLNGSGKVTFTGADTWVTTAPADALNTLVGVYEETTVPTGDYVLQNGTDGVGFYKVSAADPITINPFRAYLTTSGALDAKVRVVYEAEDATAITSLEAQDVVNETIYNLNGMRVSHPTKGIYIKNGKKFIVK